MLLRVYIQVMETSHVETESCIGTYQLCHSGQFPGVCVRVLPDAGTKKSSSVAKIRGAAELPVVGRVVKGSTRQKSQVRACAVTGEREEEALREGTPPPVWL